MRALGLIATIIVVGSAGCDDPFALGPATRENRVDTLQIFAVNGTPLTQPSAFVLATKSAPEYQGRKIDGAAIRRIYSSTKARPWWDAHLKAVKVEGKPADREWGKRLIQWHLDPEAAKARRAQGNARRLANHAKAKQRAEVQGRRPSHPGCRPLLQQ